MSGEGAAVSGRARPLSGGLWTLFSWLRRDDRSSSDDSLSSAGSDRTAASFAFLAPSAPTHTTRTSPLPPPSPPTDSYRKRVRERNLRRQHDRDLTLHHKYGLFWGDVGYDAFSLPPARRGLEPIDRQERDRRAASECCQRRAAHVPGKRRAPPPPATLPAVLTHRHSRKRRAPQPPVKLPDKPKENPIREHDKLNIILMNPKQNRDRRSLSSVENSMGCKSEKYSKKDTSKDSKSRTEKSFLKQIFENRKRNSAVETAPNKILPSISELDKQAAEIIETYKLKRLEQNNNFSERGETWFCTKCLRKYNSTVATCLHCPPENNLKNGYVQDVSKTVASASNMHTQTENGSPSYVASSSRVSGVGADEKQKLKEMLKEMKDSLPKRPKHENDQVVTNKNKTNPITALVSEKKLSTETPTLRIGSTISNENKILSTIEPQPSPSKQTSEIPAAKTTEGPNIRITTSQEKPNSFSEAVVITEQVVFVGPQPKDYTKLNNQHLGNRSDDTDLISNNNRRVDLINDVHSTKVTENKVEVNNKISKEINTPLKISSLLNPVYIPKNNISEGQSRRTIFFSQAETKISAPQVIKSPVKIINEIQLASPKKVVCIPSTSKPHTSKEQSIRESKLQSENEKLPKIALTNESKPKEDNKVPIVKKQSPSPESLPIQPVINKSDKPNGSTVIENKTSISSVLTSASTHRDKLSSNMVKFSADQHSRRRDLINQLEQSIAKGDEKAAAEAAVKLAQLRLSCSVLSFSSQIAGEFSKLLPLIQKNAATSSKIDDSKTRPAEQTSSNVDISVPSTPALRKENNKSIVNKEEKAVSTRNEIKEIKPSGLMTKSELFKNIPSEKINKNSAQPVQSNPSTSKEIIKENGSNMTSIEVWVEDREATRGPIRLRIPRQAVMGDLRRQAETTLGLAARLQRWIVGRALCTEDHTPLVSLAGADLTAPFYLCVVESEAATDTAALKSEKTMNNPNATPNPPQDDKAGDVYSELVQLEKRALVPNAEPFECAVCMEECAVGGGAVLRDCVHIFCRNCLSDLVRHCEEPAVSCPAMGCPGVLQEREIRALVLPEEYERWLARGLAAAESGTRNAFHCRTRDCTGWALCDPGVRRFPCPVCKCTNCIPCQAIHVGETCEQHRTKLQEAAAAHDEAQTDDQGTQALLDTLITKGEALQCPECSAIITKKWGCDWVKCSACKTEICWVTRGRRWGPAGRGDTSAGCRCGVDGKRCHPSCGYCH